MFGPWLEIFQWLKAHFWPSTIIKKRRLNFITIHYLYIISATIIGSILIYPAGGLAYIDALFFASGSATQSGLNTVNINDLRMEQQVILYCMTMFCTPVFINSCVVFVRLYWFERRFRNIVEDARSLRRSRTRTMTEPKTNKDAGDLEKDVRAQNITVLHNGSANGQNISGQHGVGKEDAGEESSSGSSSEQGLHNDNNHYGQLDPTQKGPGLRREITFADEVDDGIDTKLPMLPQRLSPEEHIAFLENQRNPKDKGALRIPGPKDFDRGFEPRPLGEDERDDGGDAEQEAAGVSGLRNHIRIDEPIRPQRVETTRSQRFTNRLRPDKSEHGHTSAEETVPSATRFLKVKTGTFSSLRGWASTENDRTTPYLSWQPTIGRNSAFVDLTEAQRDELGGIEYRSLKTLATVLVCYYIGWHLLGIITLLPWIVRTDRWGSIVESDGQSRVWWGFFTPASLFNDLGYTLTPDSMLSFQYAVLPLLLGSFLIIIGNTGFPCMLRFTIWFTSKVVRTNSSLWEELRFLLDHPRRCFTLLFPTKATWWLFWILVILNGLDMIFFVILDLNDSAVTGLNPAGYRVLNGLFQAASTRTAGFASVNLANLHPAIQVSYMIMMYISVFPIAISIRRTNVYEEKSLGIYGTSDDEDDDANEPSYVGAHLRRQLGFDLWYIALGLFIIAIVEGDHLANTNEYAFTLFSVLFEIVSAYGTVGLSLGYPNTDASFSSQFRVISKLVMIAMQIRGRHRGLPYELDRAVLLPSDNLHRREDQDAARRVHRRNSSLSNLDLHQSHRQTSIPHRANSAPASSWPILSNGAAVATGHDDRASDLHSHRLQKVTSHTSSMHSNSLQRGLGRVMSTLKERPRREKEESDIQA